MLQASTAAGKEAAVAELLLGYVMVPVDDLVEGLARRALDRAVGEGALVAVLESGHVEPAGGGDSVVVGVGDQLVDFVARGADLGVAIRVVVRRLDNARESYPCVAAAGEASPREVNREGHVRVFEAVRSLAMVSAERGAGLVVDRASVLGVRRETWVEAGLDVLGQEHHVDVGEIDRQMLRGDDTVGLGLDLGVIEAGVVASAIGVDRCRVLVEELAAVG